MGIFPISHAMSIELSDGAKAILDENNENVCGFCSFEVLDHDGYVKKTKGCKIEAPFHHITEQVMSGDGDSVVLQSYFSTNPLNFLQISFDESFLAGKWWFSGNDWSRTNQLCILLPKQMKLISDELEGATQFSVQAHIPFLRQASSRLVEARFAVQTQRRISKVVGVEIRIPMEAWLEFKQYRLKLFQVVEIWKKDDKKKNDKKEEEGRGE